ncbi:hypothetical protein EZV62_009055 [Acer yangbiense]|uniref:Ubiquitin thioesterase OTU n=1 Tax=Acer yangbiense TaxID=1000413 RepID=A0A5C7IEM4_9ROSI|nr:hypothetical protein EZV62_009055 [Acer yangbiense]
MDHDKNKAPELRQVISATVVSDPIKYSEAFLGKPNEEYYSWIADSEKWEIIIDARLQHMIFRPHDVICMVRRTIGPVEGLALNLVKEQHRKRSFTDTARFTLRCGVCQIRVVGQKGAVEHAQATSHVNFQEYR